MTGISKIRELLDAKKISCVELTKEYLDAAKRENTELNAFTRLTDETAVAAAKRVDEKIAKAEALSPLAGVPFVLKDSISTEGIPTTCASKMLADYTPIYNADIWEKLQNAGAVMIGKGNLDEFAMGSTTESSYFGPTKNPRDTSRVPGGSSGGSAAAVAGALSVFGIGSDTGGSVRQPASFCGIVGLKPTYGMVSRYGLLSYASSFDQAGTLTVNVRDAALVLDAISGRDERDMTSRETEKLTPRLTGSVKSKKIGIAKAFYENLPEDIDKALREAAKTYEKLGAEIVEIDFPLLKETLPAYFILACAEASSNLGRFDGLRYGYRAESEGSLNDFICKTRTEGFGQEVKRRILLGTYVLSAGYYDAYYNKAQLLRCGIINEMAKILGEVDMLLTPTSPTTAVPFGLNRTPVEIYQSDICTVPANVAGLPAISVPCGFDRDGMPIGAQLIGGKFDELSILDAALAFETETSEAFVKPAKGGVTL